MIDTRALFVVAAALFPPGTARAHEGYHTVFTHLDPLLAAALMWLVFGIPLVALAARELARRRKRRRPR